MTNEKKTKFVYWGLTAPVMLAMASGGLFMLSGMAEPLQGLAALGYPAYFAKILGTAKCLGVFAICYGRFRTLKEWAYAGMTFNLIAASCSHFFSGDPIAKVIVPLVMLGMHLYCYRVWTQMSGKTHVLGSSKRTGMAA